MTISEPSESSTCLPHISQSNLLITDRSLIFIPSVTDMNHMGPPSPSLTFQWLFNLALQDYERQTGTKLVDHPLAKQLEVCHSAHSISTFLQEQAWAFRELRGEDDGRAMRSLNRVVHILCTLFTNSALGEGVGLVCLKAPFRISNSLHVAISHSLP